MYLFHNDYNESCHDAILNELQKSNGNQYDGYGVDDYCESAAKRIRALCKNDALSVHFLTGGTQTNLTVIAASLRPHQAVLCAGSGHINVHETGAIEATGHKVVTVPSKDGKLTACAVERVLETQLKDERAEHVVQIKMVYISNPTEFGTIYNLSELSELSAVCRKYGVYLFVDGARLGYALTAEGNDVTLADMAQLCDAFYIGGTKCGAMFGEAVVISNPAIADDFRYLIKQRGGMLAKGWLLGLQFDVLMQDDLYFKLGKQANRFADKIRKALQQLRIPLYISGKTNQVFPILCKDLMEYLSKDFTFMIHQQIDEEYAAVRFSTSWATKEESVDALCEALQSFYNR